jgi:hypothetical protein
MKPKQGLEQSKPTCRSIKRPDISIGEANGSCRVKRKRKALEQESYLE